MDVVGLLQTKIIPADLELAVSFDHHFADQQLFLQHNCRIRVPGMMKEESMSTSRSMLEPEIVVGFVIPDLFEGNGFPLRYTLRGLLSGRLVPMMSLKKKKKFITGLFFSGTCIFPGNSEGFSASRAAAMACVVGGRSLSRKISFVCCRKSADCCSVLCGVQRPFHRFLFLSMRRCIVSYGCNTAGSGRAVLLIVYSCLHPRIHRNRKRLLVTVYHPR